jgi:hypothetical protein
MIGGSDVVFDLCGMEASAALSSVARIVQRSWTDAVLVDAERGTRFNSYTETEFGTLHEIFVFRDETARCTWEECGASGDNMNTIVYAIVHNDALTLVLEDPRVAPMTSILSELDGLLRNGAPWQSWKAA